jgi:phage tail-like protein
MAAYQDGDAQAGYSYFIDLGNGSKLISEVGAFSSEAKVITHKHVTDKGVPVATTTPAKPEPGTLTVKRGMTDDKAWHDWHKLACDGMIAEARKNISIVMCDYAGKEVARFELMNAWPTKHEMPALKAFDTSPAMESITLSYERVTRSK